MERRELKRGRFRTLAGLTTAAALAATFPQVAFAQSATDDSFVLYKGGRVDFPVAQDIVALQYANLSGKSMRDAAVKDAQALGLEVLHDVRRAANQVYVKASPDQAKSLVASKKSALSDDVVVKPVFYYGGVPNVKYMTVVPDTLVVAFETDPGLKELADFAAKYGLDEGDQIMAGVYRFPAGKTPTEGIPALTARIAEENPGSVKFSEPSYIFHIDFLSSTGLSSGEKGDPLFFRQWHMDNTSRNRVPRGAHDSDTDAPRAWNWNLRSTIDGGDGRTRGYFGDPFSGFNPGNPDTGFVAVAVFDSGIDLDHEEWKINQQDPDNGPSPALTIIHPELGIDGVDDDPVPDGDDEDPHGTAVAGIIAGPRNNGTGGMGIAPLARIYSVRIGDDQSFLTQDAIAELVDESTFAEIDLGNHSWGGFAPSDVLDFAFQIAYFSGRTSFGTAHFVASGNETTGMRYPSLYDYTFSVGGVDDTGNHVDYASYGGKLDFVGFTQQTNRGGILTTDFMGAPGYDTPDLTNLENPLGNYTYEFNGTSAACPVVTGVAALVLAEFPRMTPDDLFNLLASTADRYPSPLHYIPAGSNAARMAEFTPPEPPPPPEEPKGAASSVAVLGRPNGFRTSANPDFPNTPELFADGFSPYFGYGQPNPYNAIAGNFARSPLRDYTAPENPTDTRGLLGDYGELEMVWASDLGADMFAQIEACRAAIAEAAEQDPSEVEAAEILECISTGVVPETGAPVRVSDVTPWRFSGPRTFNEAVDEVGPIEMGFLPYPNYNESPVVLPRPSLSGFTDYRMFANFEFSTFLDDDPRGEGAVPCVIASNIPTGAASLFRDDEGLPIPLIEAAPGDYWYNPRGRYLARPLYFDEPPGLGPFFPEDGIFWPNQAIDEFLEVVDVNNSYDSVLTLQGAAIEDSIRPHVGKKRPWILEFTMKHELNTYDATTPFLFDAPAGTVIQEYDQINVIVNGEVIGLPIRGDTANQPLLFPAIPNDTEDIQMAGEDLPSALWPGIFNADTDRSVGFTPLTFRTYRYVIPADTVDETPELEEGGMTIQFRLTPGFSYVPEYGDQLDQVPQVRRDLMGFHLADLKIWVPDEDPDPATGLTAQDILDPDEVIVAAEGRSPVWSAAENEFFFVGRDARASGPGASVAGTVKTALDDGGTRLYAFEDAPTKTARNSFQLFTALTPSSAAAPNHTPSRILSLDAATRRSQLVYVKDGGDFQPWIWLTSYDGYGERPLFPIQAGQLAQDRGTTSAVFARLSESVFFTNGDRIEFTDLGGAVRQFVLDSSNIKRTKFADLSLTPDDGNVVFSAENSAGDRGLYVVPRALHLPNVPTFLTPEDITILDWPNSVEREPSVSPNGLYVAFASNTIDRELGTIPPANAPYKIYVAGHLADILDFGSAATLAVVEVDMRRDDRYSASPTPVTAYAAGRYPKFGPSRNDVFAFAGYTNSGPELGEIALLRFAPPVPGDPTIVPPYVPPPVDPLPVAPPAPNDQIVLAEGSLFDNAGDGWRNFQGEYGLTPGIGTVEGGSLKVVANNNNTSTYGYFQSPAKFFVPFPVQIADELAKCKAAIGRNLTPTERAQCINELEPPIYLLRYYVRRTSDDPRVAPTLRLRVNSNTWQEWSEYVVASLAPNGERVPAKDVATPLDFLFEPNPQLYAQQRHDQGYYMSMDLINFDPADDPNGGYILDRVDIFRINRDAIEELGLVRSYTFSTQSQIEEWYKHPADTGAGDGVPTFSSGNGRLTMSADVPGFNYGFWYTGVFPNTTGVDGPLFLRYAATIEADETSPFRVPDMRTLLSRLDYTNTILKGVTGIGDGSFIPAVGQPRKITSYIAIDPQTPPAPYVVSWDVLGYENYDAQPNLKPLLETTDKPVHLDAARFDVVRIKGYPSPLENP